MFTLVYKSEAAESLNDAEIEKMLQKTKIRNKKRHITGCLVYHEGYFVHLLEGEEDAVKSLFDKIKIDERHRKISVLSMEESVLRMFRDWNTIYSKRKDSNLQEQARKRQLFGDIFHSSNAVISPGNSKLALWMQVNELLNTNFARLL